MASVFEAKAKALMTLRDTLGPKFAELKLALLEQSITSW